jgi:hypothetical protein
MKTSFDVGLVEVESHIISKNNICDNNFLAIVMVFNQKSSIFVFKICWPEKDKTSNSHGANLLITTY